MTYSHGNLNVHNLDCIQAFHMAKESTAHRLCAHLKHAQLSYEASKALLLVPG